MANKKRKHIELTPTSSFDVNVVYICAMCKKEMSEPIKAYVKHLITFFVCSDKCYRGFKDQF